MKKFFISTAMVILIGGIGAVSHSASPDKKETAPKSDEMSKEMREKMATHHEKMAQCLRSDKTIKECHQAMHEQCQSEGEENCPMMGQGMMMMDHHNMMKKHQGHEKKSDH